MIQKKDTTTLIKAAKFLSSREAGFIFACLGVIVQSWHSYFIAYKLSSLEGWQQHVQALTMALFMSGPLLYFTLKASNNSTDSAKKYRRIVNVFATIDSFINMWYYINKLVIAKWPEADWFELVIAMPISWLLPLILKAYGGEVNPHQDDEQIDDSMYESLQKEIKRIEDMFGTIKMPDNKEYEAKLENALRDIAKIKEALQSPDTSLSSVQKEISELSYKLEEMLKHNRYEMYFRTREGVLKHLEIELREPRIGDEPDEELQEQSQMVYNTESIEAASTDTNSETPENETAETVDVYIKELQQDATKTSDEIIDSTKTQHEDAQKVSTSFDKIQTEGVTIHKKVATASEDQLFKDIGKKN